MTDTAQQRAEAMVIGWKKRANETIIDNHYSPTTFHGEMMADIADALLDARRDALAEAVKVVKDRLEAISRMQLDDPCKEAMKAYSLGVCNRLYAALDRLREGVIDRPRCEQCGSLLIHEPHKSDCLYIKCKPDEVPYAHTPRRTPRPR